MRRREFITLLGGAAAAWPLAARAQQSTKVWRIGMLETISSAQNAPQLDAFRQRLQQLGYVEGINFVIEYRSAEGRGDRFPPLVAELIQRNVDLLVLRGTPAAIAVKNATSTILSSYFGQQGFPYYEVLRHRAIARCPCAAF